MADNQSVYAMIVISLLHWLMISFIAMPTGVHGIGVCYGMVGDNLASPSEVVALYKSNNIDRMRLYNPNQAALEALRESNIQLMVGVPNEQLGDMASNASAADDWIRTNIIPYWPSVSFRYVAVGNELIPEHMQYAHLVLPAMENIHKALSTAGLQHHIKVSTALSAQILGSSYPPSSGSFVATAQEYLNPIVEFLARTGSVLLFNVYPYFAYKDNPRDIQLPYALFTAPGVVVRDGGFEYRNLFDAMVDAAYAALEKVGGQNVKIVVSETGWPSAGHPAATADNAKTYNQNLIRHVGGGTPRRPGALETYIFAMFNENQKPGDEVERHFGLFLPNKQPAYPISF